MALALKDTQQLNVMIITYVYFPYISLVFSNNFNFFFCFFVYFILLISVGYGEDAVAIPAADRQRHITPPE